MVGFLKHEFSTLVDVVRKTKDYEIIYEKFQSEGYTGILNLNVVVGYSNSLIPHVPPHLAEMFKIAYDKNHLSKLSMNFFYFSTSSHLCQYI